MCQPLHPDVNFWQKRVETLYPGLGQRAYFLPPLLFNRQDLQPQQVAGQEVAVLQPQPPVSDGDVRDDLCQRCVLRCFHRLAETRNEVMFVISQLNFQNYLGKPCYAAAARMLPRPVDLKDVKQDRGDFDVLVVHGRYGLLTAEIKAVGDNFAQLKLTAQQQEDAVARRLQRAIKQLKKSEDVLTHLVSDQPVRPRILKTLMFPNVSRFQLQRILNDRPRLRQELCQCVGVGVSEDPCDVCLTSDDVDSPDQWWQRWVTEAGPDPAMTSGTLYLDLVSRFCGPATTVEVFTSCLPHLAHCPDIRTLGDAVLETSWRFSYLVLHPRQVQILHECRPLMYLAGPPGTGKTIVLILKALSWLREGIDVHVISTWSGSLAASSMIVHQLKLKEPGLEDKIHHHKCDFKVGKKNIPTVVKTLAEAANGGPLYVISDEVCGGDGFAQFCTDLHGQVSQLFLWSASVFRANKPTLLEEVTFAEPLRTPPCVTREVEGSSYVGEGKDVPAYAPPSSPLATDGPPPLRVVHAGQGHTCVDLRECGKCGERVAHVLLHELRVGKRGSIDAAITDRPATLQYSDIFLLTDFVCGFRDTELDTSGNVTRQACGMITALRQAGIPVRVIRFGDDEAAARVTSGGLKEVIAAGCDSVLGLERTVIVWVDSGLRGLSRLYAASRCTSQLVLVQPKSPQ